MTKLLVTGGAGYVGSHCCKAFQQAGFDVVVFDNFDRGWRDFAKFGEVFEGDIMSPEDLSKAIDQHKPDAIAHFAAFAYVGESVGNPGMYYRNNTQGTLNILEAMRDKGIDKMIFSSTCASYGIPESVPIDESTPQSPINPYGWSKLMVEKMMWDFSNAHDMRCVALRYFNAAGADRDCEIGERHEPETHVIPLAIRGAMADDFTFTILGDDFDTRDGTCVRDYIHVEDLADAHKRAIEYLVQGGESNVFNLGTGNGTTVKEIADAVERVSGKPLPRRIGDRRPGDPPALIAAADKAREILGWEPTNSDIENIVQTAWAWHQKESQNA